VAGVPPRSVLDEMPEASYLVAETAQYRLIMRFFHERHRAHAHYVRSDEVLERVREAFAAYDDATCRRHLQQLEEWRLVRALPEQNRPRSLLEFRQRPRTYQAERLAIQLEDLRLRLESEAGAASINPAALDQLLSRLRELSEWIREGHVPGPAQDARETVARWRAAYAAFDAFARGVDYLGDLPRHRPKETLDFAGFLGYREVLTRYLLQYAHRLFESRDYARHLLLAVQAAAGGIAEAVAGIVAQQVRADATAPDLEVERQGARREIEALLRYFAAGGDVDVLLDRAQGWVVEITRHARRLSEQHVGGTVRATLLLELGRRFAGCAELGEAERLAQVAFGLTLPLHWRGAAPEAAEGGPWARAATVVPLQPVRRGRRERVAEQPTLDRTADQIAHMLAEQGERERAAQALARLFDERGLLRLDGLFVPEAADRQRLLHLLYRALAQNGRAGVGYRDWAVTVEPPPGGALGTVGARDGTLILPGFRLRLHRGRPAGA